LRSPPIVAGFCVPVERAGKTRYGVRQHRGDHKGRPYTLPMRRRELLPSPLWGPCGEGDRGEGRGRERVA